MAKLFDIEKRTQLLLGLLGLFVTLGFILVSLGKSSWLQVMALVGAVFIGLFLWFEGGWLSYIKKKGYKTLSFGDFIVWFSFVIGGLLILQAFTLFTVINNASPDWLLSFLSTNGVIIGILAGLLFLYHSFAPRPK